jgi:predicted ABC-type ATPase
MEKGGSIYHLGGDMSKHLAPNGKPSNLTHEQWHLVRTPEFKGWFGDWENDPANASKVVDENGEPLVVYHRSNDSFNLFDKGKNRLSTYGKGLYFTNLKNEYSKKGKYLYQVFLNLKNPLIIDIKNQNFEGEVYDLLKFERDFKLGAIIKNPSLRPDDQKVYDLGERTYYVADDSNQIKLADGSNTTFDAENPDIRYAEGGGLGQEITCVRCGWHWNTSDSEEYDKYVCHNCGFDNRTFYDSDPIGNYHTKDENMYNKGGFNKISLPDTESSYENLQPILAKQGYQLKRIMKPTKTVEEIAEEFDATPQFIQDQLEIGTEHEMEHTYSREVAHDTALHHLAEDPEYYIYLKDMEMRREAQKLDGYYRSGGALSGETTCEVLDKDGERQIDPESIENMTECLNDLPQTKSFHFDYETNDYKPYRKRLHRDIIYEFKKDLVCVERQQPIAILMGGSPASGKSTFLKKYAPYLLKEEIFKVDADEIRSKLPEYRGYNATQTHLETKDIVNTLLSDRNIGIPCRFDVIYDGTMNNTKSYLPLINILKREGYKVFIVYIDRVQKDVIVKRALERYKKSGRFVPLEVIDDFFTKGKEALEQLKQEVDGYMIVDGSNQDYKIIERGGDTLPKNRNYSKIGEPIKITTEDVVREFKDGGEINPDDPKIKSAMTHKAGASGGLLIGNRHSEGGIKAVNKSTGQPLEMEGGEVVITRDAVSDDKKREFEGEMLTNREILSRINQSGGGVSFAEGGDVPDKCACMGKEYKFGGRMMRDNDIVEDIMTTHRKLIGIKYPELKPSEAMQKLFDYELRYDRGGQIYGHGGTLTFVNKKIPTFDAFSKLNTDVNPQAMKKAYKNFLSKEYHINFHELPHILQASLLMGNQKLVDSYINS